MSEPNPLSPPSIVLAGAAAVVGVLTGAVQFLQRAPAHTRGSAATAAWPVHLALTGVAVLALVAVVLLARRRTGVLLTAPLRRRAVRRLRAGLASPVRALPAGVLLLLLVYSAWRIGEQVTAGLDENFRADAWGGPSYLGAMYCHYLDTGLIITVCALLLHVLLPHRARSAAPAAG